MKYDTVIFDVDGTLIDTEKTILLSLQHMLLRIKGLMYAYEELYFALGIPGARAIELLEIRESDKAMEMWLGYCDRYEFLQKPFEGMGEILQDLKDAGLRLGIVTSRTRDEFKKSVERYDFIRNFEVIICADDTKKHKPAPEPILAALDKMQIAPSRALYVGDSSYDMACAKAAGADGALALWGAHEVEKIPSVYRLKAPGDISRILTQDALHSA